MSDLVKRLRDADADSQQRIMGSRIFDEAAAHIEALEASLAHATREWDRAERALECASMRMKVWEQQVYLVNPLSRMMAVSQTEYGDQPCPVPQVEKVVDLLDRNSRLQSALHNLLDAVAERNGMRESIESSVLAEARAAMEPTNE